MSLIKKPNELEINPYIKALIYGQAGTGKTTLALSAPKPLLFDFDGGIHRVNSAHRVDAVQIKKYQIFITEPLIKNQIICTKRQRRMRNTLTGRNLTDSRQTKIVTNRTNRPTSIHIVTGEPKNWCYRQDCAARP